MKGSQREFYHGGDPASIRNIAKLIALRHCNYRGKKIGDIVKLLKKLKEEDMLHELVPSIQYKHFFDVCRRCRPIPLKEAIQFTEACELYDKRMFTQLVGLCKASGRLEEAFKLVSSQLRAPLSAKNLAHSPVGRTLARARGGRPTSVAAPPRTRNSTHATRLDAPPRFPPGAPPPSGGALSSPPPRLSTAPLINRPAYRPPRPPQPGLMKKMGMKPDTVMYTSIITACAAKGDSNHAFEMFAIMKEENVRPNEFTFTALMHACCQEMRGLKRSSAADVTVERRAPPPPFLKRDDSQ